MQFAFLYVAAIFGLFVFLWNRFSSTRIEWRIATLFYLLVLVLLFKPLTGRFVGYPADLLLSLPPWAGTEKVIERSNHEINDVVLQMVPWAHQVRESWKRGEAPLWNENAGGGYPLLANGQSGAFSIFRFLALPFDLARSFTIEAALKLLLALAGAYVFMRRRGSSSVSSTVTAVSFGLSTFLVVWLYFPHVSTAVFLPLVFYGIDRIVERAHFTRLAFLAVVFGVMLLNGHPETAAHIVFASSLWLLWLLITGEARWKAAGAIIIAGLLGLALAAPMVLPLLEALPYSQRMDFIKGEKLIEANFVPSLLVVPLQVGYYGMKFDKTMWGPTIAEFVSTYAGIGGVIGWFAALFQLRRRQWRDPLFFFVPATIVVLGIAYNWPFFADAFRKIPVFSLAANGRLRLVFCFFLAILAGKAVESLSDAAGRRAVLLATIVTALLLASLFVVVPPPSEFAQVAWGSTLPRAIVIVAFAFAILASHRERLVRFVPAAIIAAVSFDLLHWDVRWNPPVPSRLVYPTTPAIDRLVALERSPGRGEIVPFRIAATSATLFPNSAAMFGLEDIRAHDPMAYGRYLGALRVFTEYSSDEYFAMLRQFDHPFLDFLNVRYVLTGSHEEIQHPRYQKIYDAADGRIYRNTEALPRFFPARNVIVEGDDLKRLSRIRDHRDWANTVFLKYIPSDLEPKVRRDFLDPRPLSAPMAKVSTRPMGPGRFRVRVDAPRWTMIVSSVADWPGWKIYREGERLRTIAVNETFMGFAAPPGPSEIDVVYEPRSYTIGWQLALLTLGALAFMAAATSWFHRRRA